MTREMTPVVSDGKTVSPNVWGEMVQAGTAVLGTGWWEPEHVAGSDWFVWGGASAEIGLPACPPGTRMELDFMPAPGPAPLELSVNGAPGLSFTGTAVRNRYWLPAELLTSKGRNTLTFSRAQGYVPNAADPRALAVQFFGVRVVGPGVEWAGRLASDADRNRVQVRATGLLGPEDFPGGPGVWTNPQARLWFPAGPGTLTLTIWAPRPAPLVELLTRGARLLGPVEVGAEPVALQVRILAGQLAQGGLDLELRATPFCPAKDGASGDTRELGVVIGHASFTPASHSS
jgi:hypothetical protein